MKHTSQVESRLYCGKGTAGVRRSYGGAAAQPGLSERTAKVLSTGDTRADTVSGCEGQRREGHTGQHLGHTARGQCP